MRGYKVLSVLFAAAFCLAQWASAQSEVPESPFFRINKNVKRIGLDEIKGASSETVRTDIVPSWYRLAPGDKLEIKLFGKIEAAYEISIDNNGNVTIPSLGRINVAGLTTEEACLAVKKVIDMRYANVDVDLSVSGLSRILVKVTGHVIKPGTYAVSPFANMAEIVAKAGGPNRWGGLSDIRLIRNDKNAATFSMYDYLFKAHQAQGPIIQNGDIVYVPEIKNLIAVRGEVRYPGIYDVESASALSGVINTAGGLIPGGKSKIKVSVLRLNPQNNITEVVKDVIFEPSKGLEPKDDLKIENYDTIVLTSTLEYIPDPENLLKMARISGEVKVPGEYLIKENEALSSMIKRAGGLKDTAFIEGSVFTRDSLKNIEKNIADQLVEAQERAVLAEKNRIAASMASQEEKKMRYALIESKKKVLNLMKDRQQEGRIIIDLESILNGRSDIVLVPNDILFIPSVPDWVMVTGAVYGPKSVTFAKGKPMEHYIDAVGGIPKITDTEEIFVIKPNGRIESKSTGYGKILPGDIIVALEKI